VTASRASQKIPIPLLSCGPLVLAAGGRPGQATKGGARAGNSRTAESSSPTLKGRALRSWSVGSAKAQQVGGNRISQRASTAVVGISWKDSFLRTPPTSLLFVDFQFSLALLSHVRLVIQPCKCQPTRSAQHLVDFHSLVHDPTTPSRTPSLSSLSLCSFAASSPVSSLTGLKNHQAEDYRTLGKREQTNAGSGRFFTHLPLPLSPSGPAPLSHAPLLAGRC